MIIHVGAGKLITDGEIVGIFDLDGESFSSITSSFLKKAEKEGATVSATDDLPRAFVLTEKKGRQKVIFSRLSSAALTRRTEERTPQAEDE